jgi:hypothetical protein
VRKNTKQLRNRETLKRKMKKSLAVAASTGVLSAALLLYLRQPKRLTDKSAQDKKVGVNKRFFEQLKFLLRICIPTCTLKAFIIQGDQRRLGF